MARACLIALFLCVICASTQLAQETKDPVSNLLEFSTPGLLIVIFSPEVDTSRRTAAQGAVWSNFVATLKKKKVTALEVINEVAVNDGADRARAFELAMTEQKKYTIWLQFSALNEATSNSRKESSDAETLIARYIVFAPASNNILSQGEVEQERIPESRFQTANNEKVFRDNSGRVVNSRAATRLPDGSMSTGQKMIDIDALKRVGEQVAERVVSVIKKQEKSRTP